MNGECEYCEKALRCPFYGVILHNLFGCPKSTEKKESEKGKEELL